MPGLPGAACKWSVSALSARTSACSRPPDPMTRMRTPGAYRRLAQQIPELEGLVPARADADRAHRGADHLLDGRDVGLRVLGQVGEGPGGRDVLGPAVEVLINRHRVVEVGLRDRDLLLPLPVHLVGHAD